MMRQNERGAILVHVAVAMVGLLGFSALTIDMGMVWVARAQLQNVADAGAHAGAVELMDPLVTDDVVRGAAMAVAQLHTVLSNVPIIAVDVGACPAGAPPSGNCALVVASQDVPPYFSTIFGAGPTPVRASAAATVLEAPNPAPGPPIRYVAIVR